MHRFCLLPLRFSPEQLSNALSSIQQHWLAHFVTSNYEGDWSVIPLMALAGSSDDMISDSSKPPEAYAPTPTLLAAFYFQEVIASFHCPVTSVRLMKLAQGSSIKEHRDLDLSVACGTVRLHIPITTNPEVEFYVEDERAVMAPGECWYLDATLPHRLANRGATDRVHMVLDCVVNDWLRALFQQGGYQPKQLDFFEQRNIRPTDFPHVLAALRALGTETGVRHAATLEAEHQAYFAQHNQA
jgi:quercetin dioxygenase-like cupin family protein